MQIILGLVMITFGAFGNNYECRAVQWPFSRQVAKINVPELSLVINRECFCIVIYTMNFHVLQRKE